METLKHIIIEGRGFRGGHVNVTRTRNCCGWPSSPPCTQCVMSLLNDAYSIALTLQIFPHAMKNYNNFLIRDLIYLFF